MMGASADYFAIGRLAGKIGGSWLRAALMAALHVARGGVDVAVRSTGG